MYRRLAPILGIVLLVTACTSEGLPSSYSDQDRRAEVQFVEACEESLADADEPDPNAYCQCAFYTVAAELTFAEFIDLDEKLKDDAGALSLEERQLLESISLPCQFTAADINTAVVAE